MSLMRYILKEYSRGVDYLYHFTNAHAIESILQQNKLVANVPNDIKRHPEYYPDELQDRKSVSLTVNSYMESFGDFRIKLNRKSLERDYELAEFTDPSLSGSYEREVIVLHDIQPLDKYIADITCLYYTTDDYDSKYTNKVIKKVVEKYGNKIDFKILKNEGFEDNTL